MAWRPTVDRSGEKPCILFNSGGFELFVPPTPFRPPDHPPFIVMLEDLRDAFYEVDYDSGDLRNSTPWNELQLHNVVDPAIVFPSLQWQKFESLGQESVDRVTGFLVDIQSRQDDVMTAVKLGAVHVRRYPQEIANWRALESIKGPELGAEMRAGLLRKVYDKRSGSEHRSMTYVRPKRVLDEMTDPWHEDGATLNWHLDGRFVGAMRIERHQAWRLYAE